ncbi:hypothetical protein LPJ53_000089 [Coemansia erecta]|uniref:Galactose oxidase n=1 Tax=Coemansia erecta TaxID=147472 RepID=A0A9W7Y8E5_9FUNG|nr:hypothetical protein LPJ53_000089 [Coemansia erecta]
MRRGRGSQLSRTLVCLLGLSYPIHSVAAASLETATLTANRRSTNLNETQAVTDVAAAWRAFACLVPFSAPDSTALMLLYGGTNDAGATDPLSIAPSGLSSIQVFDVANNMWYAPYTKGGPSTGSILPGCGASSDSIWVYDSQYGVAGKDSTAVSFLDSTGWSWSTPTETGQLPVTRFGAAFAYVPSTKLFYMHGGIPLSDDTNTADNPPGIANNMDLLSPSSNSWMYASNGPARKYHTLCYMESIESLVMFGGSDQNIASYNDVKVFSTKTNIWQYAVSISGDMPAERILHSAVCTGDTMYVFGGLHSINDSPSDSAVWTLKASSATSFTWSKAPIVTGSGKSTGPTARAGHSAVLYNNQMYIYGGVGPSDQDSTMYTLDLNKWAWSTSAVSGGSDSSQSARSNTRVLVAAIVASVLGVVCIGIAAFVFYRWNRRRGSSNSTPSTAAEYMDGNNDDDALEQKQSDLGFENGDIGAEQQIRSDSTINGNATTALASATHTGDANDYSRQYKEAGYLFMGGAGSTAVYGRNRNSDIVANNYLPSPHTNPSLGSSMVTFSPPMSPAAQSISPAEIRAGTSYSNSNSQTQISAPQTPTSANTRHQRDSPDAPEVTDSYTHADIVSSILHSGQPIPAWLREAARRASTEGAAEELLPPSPPADRSATEVHAPSVYSDTTNDAQSAQALEPIKYMDLSRVSTQRTSSMLQHTEYGAHRRLNRRNSELSEINFDLDTQQRLNFGTASVLPIAEPMVPPVPLRMNSLYGELGNSGIVVGQADEIPPGNRVQHHRLQVADGQREDALLSPLDRLAQYHTMNWDHSRSAAPNANADNEVRASDTSPLGGEGNESDDTSDIYVAQPVRRSSLDSH